MQSQELSSQVQEREAIASNNNIKQFVFTSQNKTINAQGVASVVSNKGLNKDAFIEKVHSELSQMEEKGVENPIVIGAIPFDIDQPTELFIPHQYQMSDYVADAEQFSLADNSTINNVTSKEHYQNSVKSALSLFEQTELEKVVLSRAIEVQTSQPINGATLAKTLSRQNRNAYVFSIPQTNGSTLIGASPELLIRKEHLSILSNPLAGSRKRVASEQDNLKISDELWHCQKDRYEHKLVADAVSKALSPHSKQLDAPEHPSVISTPTMWHLSTEISGELANADTSLLELVYDLHPTPAVCGTPTALAKETINQLEGYAREEFCGAVGWMDSHGNGEWVVTIRCGQIKDNVIRLYAGAGIVPGSVPEDEYRETENKLNTMLNAFGFKQTQEKLAG